MKNKSWKELGEDLTEHFKICGCQRKLKTIVDDLYEIYTKLKKSDFTFTGSQWLIIAILDMNTNAITHGSNCEYPILMDYDPFWKWLEEAKNNPNLEDN